MKTYFVEISLRAKAHGRCATCNKIFRRSKKFWQTVNPFNKIGNRPKERHEILDELRDEAKRWMAETRVCASCEPEEK